MSRLDTIQEQLENLKTTRVAAQPMDLEQSIASSEHVRALNGLMWGPFGGSVLGHSHFGSR